MPYITQERRKTLGVVESEAANAGELNYEITHLINSYFNINKNYQSINDVLGALEGAKLEFYRRIVEPYENRKWTQNGDVY